MQPTPPSNDEARARDATIAALRKALLRDPADVRSLRALAQSLFDAGRVREAIGRLRQIVKVMPHDPGAHLDLALALVRSDERGDKTKEAQQLLQRALAIDPRSAVANVELGNLLLRNGASAAAESHYRAAIALDPSWASPHVNLGALKLASALPHEAVAHYRDALARDSGDIEAANGLGAALLAAGQVIDALARLRTAVTHAPRHRSTRLNLGRALRMSGAVDEAVGVHVALTNDHPDMAAAWDELAADLRAADDLDGALAAARRATDADPGRATLQMNLGNLLAETGHWTDAVRAYRRALQRAPGLAAARWNLGLAELTLGDFRNGWDHYEARWNCADFPSPRRSFASRPLAPGDDVSGKTVLVHAEQGFGDTIQFLRFVPPVAAQGASVIVEVPASLVGLARQIDGVAAVVATGDPLPATDFHVPLLSLPRVLGRHRPDGSAVPYLHGSAPAPAADGPLRVGIAWAGSGGYANDRRRSLRLDLITRWFDLPTIEWVGLQKAVPPADAALAESLVVRLPRLFDGVAFDDFEQTARAIAGLDLVVSVDTAVAHLAGAIGKPVWILLPFAPDFRWLLDRADSPWYPTARLFRARAVNRWDGVPEAVETALGAFRRP